MEPTIFTGVNNAMRIAQEEIFGPVLSILRFKDEDEAVRIANDVRFGLGAGVWTRDIGRAIRMSERIQAGTVWVNTYRAVSYMSPFGGYKDSGVGRENGAQAIYEYLQLKSVWINTGARHRQSVRHALSGFALAACWRRWALPPQARKPKISSSTCRSSSRRWSPTCIPCRSRATCTRPAMAMLRASGKGRRAYRCLKAAISTAWCVCRSYCCPGKSGATRAVTCAV